MMNGLTQAVLYRLRRSHLANRIAGSLPLWQPGLLIEAGMFVQNAAGNVYQAQNGGVTGANEPQGVEAVVFTDGAVHWIFQSPRVFLSNPNPTVPS